MKARPLDPGRVFTAGVEFADRNGLQALTMRSVAQQLGVEAMSLYHHVGSKGRMIEGMLDIVAEEFELPAGGDDWRQAIRASAVSIHDALRRHPWAVVPLATGPSLANGRLRQMDALLRCLRTSGFSPAATERAFHALDSHIMGSTLWAIGTDSGFAAVRADLEEFLERLPRAAYPDFCDHVDQHLADVPAEPQIGSFVFVLDLILDSLESIRQSS